MQKENEPKYKHLAIFEKGDAILPKNTGECFLDGCTYDLMLIEDLSKAAYIGEMSFGLKVYSAHRLKGRVMNINDTELWPILYAHGFLDWPENTDQDNPLQWALSQEHIRNTEIFDFLYSKFPDTELDIMFWHAATIEAAKWLSQPPHQADKNYPGLRCGMRDAVAMNRFQDTPEILAYLYPDSKLQIGG